MALACPSRFNSRSSCRLPANANARRTSPCPRIYLGAAPHILGRQGSRVYAAPHIVYAAPHIVYAAPHIVCAAPHIVYAAPHIVYAAPHIVYAAPHILIYLGLVKLGGCPEAALARGRLLLHLLVALLAPRLQTAGGLSLFSSAVCWSSLHRSCFHVPSCCFHFWRSTSHLRTVVTSRSGRHAPAYPESTCPCLIRRINRAWPNTISG